MKKLAILQITLILIGVVCVCISCFKGDAILANIGILSCSIALMIELINKKS
jgi:diacylglycerol kinase